MATNDWCAAAGIEPPNLGAVCAHPEANAYNLLVAALLERGAPMTLDEVAARFEAVGYLPAGRALVSLSRCRPARAPVYRDGDRYALDPHDERLDLIVFRLDLRPPRFAPAPPPPAPPPLPGPDVPLTEDELDEAWQGAHLFAWSHQRLAVAVLDALGPRPASEVVAAVRQRTSHQGLSESYASQLRRRGSAIVPDEQGRWTIAADGADAVRSARIAVRERVARVRRQRAPLVDPAVLEARRAEVEREREDRAAELAALSRALVVAFPPERPRAAALVDVGAHTVDSYVGEDELTVLRDALDGFDVIGAVEVRPLLQALGVDPGDRRLHELGPPQKSKKLNRAGRKLQITTALLAQGSCGIGRPFGDPDKLAAYLASGEHTKLRRRLEADAKALHALYQYGRLHGMVRLRWGFLDERLPAPWAHRGEPMLYTLKRRALASGGMLEVVVGSAPGWEDPWSRRQRVAVVDDPPYRTALVDERGVRIRDGEVQLARLLGE